MAPSTRRQNSKESNKEESNKTGKSTKSKATTSNKNPTDKWICLLHDEIITSSQDRNGDELQPSICRLKHPRTNAGTLFLISADDSSVFQLYNFKEKYRSWFIGNTIHSDGSLYFTSPVDPLFLLLPYLMAGKESAKFMTLDQLMCDDDFPDCPKLVEACSHDQIKLIADYKDIDEEIKVFRYNKEKTLEWLRIKTETLADALETKNVHVSSKSSQSSIFVRSKSSLTSRDAFIEYAHGIVSDFLCCGLEEELKTHLGIKPEENQKQESQEENEPPSKKAKLTGDITPTDDYSLGSDLKKAKKSSKLTSAQKQLSKVDKSGMKSISSFFSPKS